ncbi:MAG TPA: RnfABCDGE type electron transport complex subunit D [Prolixibacteraceae bacterium]|nr:RnfABCDGE type electron transport complex subunit D [Bacteroidales bacterium]HQN94396.1 RnfABCDGE type electron transport complex subunit D [Prolixibacteraceae bacterium]
MNKQLTITPSPHIHQGDSVKKIMYSVVFALLPALGWSFFVFGIPALLVTLVSVVMCLLSEFVIQKYLLKEKPSITDGSALITGILLAMNVPSSLPLWMIALGALFSIGIAKMTFGGLGNNPFNPALVGRVFLLISFPVQMTTWPIAGAVDGTTGATPLGLIKEGLKTGKPIAELTSQLPSYSDLFLGNMGGSLGEVSALLLLIGLAFMLVRKVITWHIPVAVIGSMYIFTGILNLINPAEYINPMYHLLTGGALLGAIFMATDMVTSPVTKTGQLIFGAGIGIITVLIRVWGAYPEGMSFAILIMNAFTPLINIYVKPKRFGRSK